MRPRAPPKSGSFFTFLNELIDLRLLLSIFDFLRFGDILLGDRLCSVLLAFFSSPSSFLELSWLSKREEESRLPKPTPGPIMTCSIWRVRPSSGKKRSELSLASGLGGDAELLASEIYFLV